jgi:3-deoxy-7-phosphoheptulonate synthase
MIIVLRAEATEGDVRRIEESLKSRGLSAHISRGVERTIIGAIGDERNLDPEMFEGLPVVEKVLRILSPFKLVSREFQKEDTVIEVNGRSVGGRAIALFAGPCSVEGRDMMMEIGGSVAGSGATFLRGGAFKPAFPSPRSSWTHGTSTWWCGTPTSSRSGRGTCRISACSRRSASSTSR